MSKPFLRRNGWVVNPRQGDPAALIVEDKWWHDNSKSPYWAYFQCNDSYNERSHAGVAFYDEFHMPRVVFDDLQQMFSGVKDGNVKHVYGVYALVDGGYHFWRVLICGNSFASDVFSARFAKLLESVHKDPERFFGIIKKRFHSIDGGMRWRDPKQHHYAFCLCCMLHNMIARHRKYHTVGQDPDDYMKAKLVDDQLRLQRQSPSHAGKGEYMPHPVNDVAVGNVTARLREPAFFALRQALIANYEAQWEQQAVLSG